MRLGQGLVPTPVVPIQGGCKQLCHCDSGGKGKTEWKGCCQPSSITVLNRQETKQFLNQFILLDFLLFWEQMVLPLAFFWHQGRLFPTCACSVFSVMAPRTLSVFCFSILWQTVCACWGEIRQNLQLPFRSVSGGKRIKEDTLVPGVDTPQWTVAHIDFLWWHLHL